MHRGTIIKFDFFSHRIQPFSMSPLKFPHNTSPEIFGKGYAENKDVLPFQCLSQ